MTRLVRFAPSVGRRMHRLNVGMPDRKGSVCVAPRAVQASAVISVSPSINRHGFLVHPPELRRSPPPNPTNSGDTTAGLNQGVASFVRN